MIKTIKRLFTVTLLITVLLSSITTASATESPTISPSLALPDIENTGMSISSNDLIKGEDLDMKVAYQFTPADMYLSASSHKQINVTVLVNDRLLREVPLNIALTEATTGRVSFGEGGGSSDFTNDFYALTREGRNKITVKLDNTNVLKEINEFNNDVTVYLNVTSPLNLVAKPNPHKDYMWNLSWSSRNTQSFTIYRSINNSQFVAIGHTQNKSLSVGLGRYDVKYCYYVVGLTNGGKSQTSKTVCIVRESKKLPDLVIEGSQITATNDNKKFQVKLRVANLSSKPAYSIYDSVRVRVYINGQDHGFESLPLTSDKLFLKENERKSVQFTLDYSDPVNGERYNKLFHNGENKFEFGIDKIYLKGNETRGYILESNENNNTLIAIVMLNMGLDNEYFKDVKITDWVYPFAVKLKNKGIIQGDILKPNEKINRSESVAMLVRAYEEMYGEIRDTTTHEFDDVSPRHWIYMYLQKALSKEIIADNDDFNPNGEITRAQFSKIIATTFLADQISDKLIEHQIFNDVSTRHWAGKYIYLMKRLGLINGYRNGNFGPDNQVMRAEAIKILVNAMEYVDPDIFTTEGYEEI